MTTNDLPHQVASPQVYTDDESRRGAQNGACEPCVLSGCRDGAGRLTGRPLLALRVRSRIRLAELPLTSLYGQPWLLTGAVGGGASAGGRGGFDTGAGADSSLAAAVAAKKLGEKLEIMKEEENSINTAY